LYKLGYFVSDRFSKFNIFDVTFPFGSLISRAVFLSL
jgi:hypothetical protein